MSGRYVAEYRLKSDRFLWVAIDRASQRHFFAFTVVRLRRRRFREASGGVELVHVEPAAYRAKVDDVA